MVLTEAGLIGLLAAVLGLVLGMALSLDLIYVINKQSFGWTIQFHPPLGLLAAALLAVWMFTVAAGSIRRGSPPGSNPPKPCTKNNLQTAIKKDE